MLHVSKLDNWPISFKVYNTKCETSLIIILCMVHISNDIIHMNILHIHRSTAGFMCSKRIFTDINHNYNQHVSCEESVSVTQVLSSIMLILMLSGVL